jgi:hypothetical protein
MSKVNDSYYTVYIYIYIYTFAFLSIAYGTYAVRDFLIANITRLSLNWLFTRSVNVERTFILTSLHPLLLAKRNKRKMSRTPQLHDDYCKAEHTKNDDNVIVTDAMFLTYKLRNPNGQRSHDLQTTFDICLSILVRKCR